MARKEVVVVETDKQSGVAGSDISSARAGGGSSSTLSLEAVTVVLV